MRRLDAENREDRVALGQTHMRERKVRVALHSCLKIGERFAQRDLGSPPSRELAVEIELIGLSVARVAAQRRHGAGKVRSQRSEHAHGDRVLDREDVGKAFVVTLRPQLAAVGHVEQPRRDAQRIAVALNVALQHDVDSELAAGSKRILLGAREAAHGA